MKNPETCMHKENWENAASLEYWNYGTVAKDVSLLSLEQEKKKQEACMPGTFKTVDQISETMNEMTDLWNFTVWREKCDKSKKKLT